MASLAMASTTLARPAQLTRKPFSGTSLKVRAAAPRPRTSLARPLIEARASTTQAYICVDCGWIYDGSDGPFEKLPSSYKCPVCQAPKRRFKAYSGAGNRKNDAGSMKARMGALKGGKGVSKVAASGSEDTSIFLYGAIGGAVLLGALYFFLSSQYN